MKLAIVSLNKIWENKSINLDMCKKYIQRASRLDVDLIIFPEMTLTGFSNNIDFIGENQENSTTVSNFSKIANDFNISIIFGIVIKVGTKALNKSIFIDNHGNIIGDYSKIHPFSFSGEDKYFISGNKICIVKFKDFDIGLTICYDLRFPELYSALAKRSDIIVNIANWPQKKSRTLGYSFKARSIENRTFIVGVNRTGIDGNNLEYVESSQVFNANGQKLKPNAYVDMRNYMILTKKLQKVLKINSIR